MAEKNEKSKARKTDGRSDSERGKRRQRIFGIAGALVSFATTAAVAATIAVGHGPLMARASELKRADLKVAFEWPPLAGKATSRTADGRPATWMSAEQRDELERIAIKLLSGDPFDRGSLEKAQAALRDTGWFAEGGGPWLRRLENGIVVIAGRWRTPVAAVRTTDARGSIGDRLVSQDGESLPVVYPLGRSPLPVVLGVRAPEPAPGAKWSGGEVQAGLKLAAFLRDMPGIDQIAGVDVSEFATHKRLVIVTTTGGRIVWGGPPDEFLPGQAPAATKRQRLTAVYQQVGQIDAGRAEIDVRSEDGVYTLDTTVPQEPVGPKTAAKAKPTAKNRR